VRPFVTGELRSRRRMLAALGAGAFSYLLMMALTYHSIGVQALGQAFHGSAPRAFTAFSGSRRADILSPHGWMGLGFNHPMLMITSLTVALAIGTAAIAGEVDSGRAQLLFTAPLARTRFLAATLLVWLLAEAAVLVAGLAGALLGAGLSGDLRHAGVGALVWAPVQFFPLTLFVAAVAFLASALSATRGRALSAAVGITVCGYLLSVVSGLVAALDWLRWITPFGYYDPGAAIAAGPRPWPFLALVLASAVLLELTRRVLADRDLA
jgi:ABC-2 type transport system permease protein